MHIDVQLFYLNLGLVTARYLSHETATIIKIEQHNVNLGQYFTHCSNVNSLTCTKDNENKEILAEEKLDRILHGYS